MSNHGSNLTHVTLSNRSTKKPPQRFLVLAYRMPPKPTASRVAVWRALKKSGAVYLQDSVCVLPDTAGTRRELSPVLERITRARGRFHLLPLRTAPDDEQAKLIDLFVEQSTQHYQEIIENCEVNFVKEIEFEIFRENFTYEEAEEIRMEFECLVGDYGLAAGAIAGTRKVPYFSTNSVAIAKVSAQRFAYRALEARAAVG